MHATFVVDRPLVFSRSYYCSDLFFLLRSSLIETVLVLASFRPGRWRALVCSYAFVVPFLTPFSLSGKRKMTAAELKDMIQYLGAVHTARITHALGT